MTTITYNGKEIKISDRDYREVYVDCEGACVHCMLDGSCKLQDKLKKKSNS
jgi:hypothetical protein